MIAIAEDAMAAARELQGSELATVEGDETFATASDALELLRIFVCCRESSACHLTTPVHSAAILSGYCTRVLHAVASKFRFFFRCDRTHITLMRKLTFYLRPTVPLSSRLSDAAVFSVVVHFLVHDAIDHIADAPEGDVAHSLDALLTRWEVLSPEVREITVATVRLASEAVMRCGHTVTDVRVGSRTLLSLFLQADSVPFVPL